MHRKVLRGAATVLLAVVAYFSETSLAQRHAGKDDPRPTSQITAEMKTTKGGRSFLRALPKDFEFPENQAGELLLREYGAVFVARGGAVPPPRVMFRDEAEVSQYQSSLKTSKRRLGPHTIELQSAAMDALDQAVRQARAAGLTITPRGSDSARRSFSHTVTLWSSRVEPGLNHWVRKGRVSAAEARRIRALRPHEQVPVILELESRKIFFSKDLAKSIIYSVAPPGASQHLSMLALDIAEFGDARVRAILAGNGWYQTVTSDLPHFTYLGVYENELPDLGLKRVRHLGRDYWVPDLPPQDLRKSE